MCMCSIDRVVVGPRPGGYRAFSTYRAAVLGIILLCIPVGPAGAQVFSPDAPILQDPDELDMPPPEQHGINGYHDFLINTFGSPSEYHGPALNTNSLGDVPNSSWYTQRHYHQPMSMDELRRGLNSSNGPSRDEQWQVVAGKTEGKSIGMQIVDARGDRYLLKFDPLAHMEMTTGAEVISTKFFYALGYHVPENYVVRFDRGQLTPGEDAMLAVDGSETPITMGVIDTLLFGVPRYPDGAYRALASKFLPGDPLGPFLYWGTRPDDANDIFPHEARRELRGLRVFSAWLNHTDARSANTLDMLIEEEGRQFVRHHLIDFGSTLGAGALIPKRRWDGFEYIVHGGPIAVRVLTLGVLGLEWAGIKYPDEPAVGHIDAAHFDPDDWRPQYPNPAFIRMDRADAFWAARQVMHFTPEEIGAIVETGEYSDPEVQRYLTDVLLERRRRIGEAYLRFGGGLDRIETAGANLRFEDLIAKYALGRSPGRHVVWKSFNNLTGELGETLAAGEVRGTSVAIPSADARYLSAEIRTPGIGTTRVYLRDREVVGIERR